MTCLKGRSESPFCTGRYSDSSSLKYSVCQGAVFWDSILEAHHSRSLVLGVGTWRCLLGRPTFNPLQ